MVFKYDTVSGLSESCDKLRDQNKRLREALRRVDCGCTLRERESGHRVGCWKPEVDAILAETEE